MAALATNYRVSGADAGDLKESKEANRSHLRPKTRELCCEIATRTD